MFRYESTMLATKRIYAGTSCELYKITQFDLLVFGYTIGINLGFDLYAFPDNIRL